MFRIAVESPHVDQSEVPAFETRSKEPSCGPLKSKVSSVWVEPPVKEKAVEQ